MNTLIYPGSQPRAVHRSRRETLPGARAQHRARKMWQARVDESTVLNDAGRLDAGTDDEWAGARLRPRACVRAAQHDLTVDRHRADGPCTNVPALARAPVLCPIGDSCRRLRTSVQATSRTDSNQGRSTLASAPAVGGATG